MKLENWNCDPYHIYGDSKDRAYSLEDLKNHFEINGEDYAKVTKDFIGDPHAGEHYSYKAGDYALIFKTNRGFLIRNSSLKWAQ